MWCLMPFLPLGKQGQADLSVFKPGLIFCEFKVSLVYIVVSRTPRAYLKTK